MSKSLYAIRMLLGTFLDIITIGLFTDEPMSTKSAIGLVIPEIPTRLFLENDDLGCTLGFATVTESSHPLSDVDEDLVLFPSVR